jgi:hypothetical protein
MGHFFQGLSTEDIKIESIKQKFKQGGHQDNITVSLTKNAILKRVACLQKNAKER